jgi:hypothetical protein
MADMFVELTRMNAEMGGTPVLVNLGNVAWIEADEQGMSRIVFAVVLPYERANGVPLTLVVREGPGEIALLAGVVQKTDRDAIAQAWVDQRGRRRVSAEDE